jgi:Mrp family chromosome partitioning ATPase
MKESSTEKEKLVELLGINLEIGWNCNYDCENCYRFFDCPSPHKHRVYGRGRMAKIKENLANIKTVVAILSGKGGVGKSTVSSQLAMALAQQGCPVGIIDSDFHGPSVPKLLGVKNQKLRLGPRGIVPVEGPWGIKVISSDFLLEKKESLTWFDDLKREALEEFLAHVDYGKLDWLLVDLPPGTGSETINLLKYLPQLKGVIAVTVPSQVSQGIAHRCISLCQRIPVPILGLVENMSGFTCPVCGYVTSILQSGGGEELAHQTHIPFLGSIPLDPRLREVGDKGRSILTEFPQSLPAQCFLKIAEKIAEKKFQATPSFESIKQTSSPDTSSQPELLKINMETGCYQRRCDECSRYFECSLPYKKSHFKGIRQDKITRRVSLIKHKLAVMSGKGGVGKSTVSANIALVLARQGYRVGIVDSDFHGPCIPKLLGVKGRRLMVGKQGILPVEGPLGVKVISLGFLLEEGEAISWFHNLKTGALGDFLAEVNYGRLDWLVIDLPPGTGSENYNLLRDLPRLDGVVAVTIPSQLSKQTVERGLSLYRQADVPILGIIENMAGFSCPHCNTVTPIFSKDIGKGWAKDLGVPWLGSIPLDERISRTSDAGVPFVIQHPHLPASRKLEKIVNNLIASRAKQPHFA